jgi:sugar/nucleoside kinase (ribokinase family)
LSAALQSPEQLPLFLCIGDLDVDVMIEVDRLPTRDGKVNGVVKQKAPGGMAGNVAAALARLGSRVRVLGRVGDDGDGAFAVKSLEHAGVDTSFVARLSGVATFSCISLLTPDGEKSLIKLMTLAYRPDPGDVTEATLNGVRHLHLTSVGDPALCRRVVDAARSSGATASLDIERADCPQDASILVGAVEGFDLVFCNAESRAFVDAALGRPLASLVAELVTTLGADGAQVETAEGRIASPGFAPRLSTRPARATASPPPAFTRAWPQSSAGRTPFASRTAPRRSQPLGSALSPPCRPPSKSLRIFGRNRPEH